MRGVSWKEKVNGSKGWEKKRVLRKKKQRKIALSVQDVESLLGKESSLKIKKKFREAK